MSRSTEITDTKNDWLRLPSWISGEHLPSANEELRRRYRVQMLTGISLIFVYLMYLFSILFYFDSWVWSVAFLSVPVFGVALMVYLYHTGNVDLVGHGTCLLVLCGVGIPNFMTGGVSGANAASMLIFPVTALIVADRWGLAWVGVSIFLIMGFQALDLWGFEFPQVIPPESKPIDTTVTLLISSLVIPGVLWFSEIARRRAEAGLLEIKERAESANRAKGQFLANMSHEFRTPLNGILGLTEVMLNREQEPEQRHQMEMVKNSANAILVLVNDILDFERVEENKLELYREKFKLRQTLLDIIEVLKVQADHKNLALSLDISDSLPTYLVGDSKRFSQVVSNIVANAIKFTERGSVTVTVEQGQLVDEDLELIVKVADTGIGILPERRDAIFEAFTQADGSTTRRFGGSGLGLAISNKLIGLMGGAISVDSKPGHGSVFTFTAWFGCPGSLCGDFSTNFTPTPVNTFSLEENSRRYKVLLAEDNEINQHMTKAMLEQMGHMVDVVSNGKDALECLESGKHDVVFMDVQMPLMDGFTATKSIRQREGSLHRHTWIVAMTANAMPGDKELCLESGMDDYVAKPLTMQSLSEILAKVPGQGRLREYGQQDGTGEEHKVLDLDELVSRTRGDSALVIELLDIFKQSSADLLNEMEGFLEEQDFAALSRTCHSLKGASGMMGAKRLRYTAQQVELLCRREQKSSVEDGISRVKIALEELYPAMEEAKEKLSSS